MAIPTQYEDKEDCNPAVYYSTVSRNQRWCSYSLGFRRVTATNYSVFKPFNPKHLAVTKILEKTCKNYVLQWIHNVYYSLCVSIYKQPIADYSFHQYSFSLLELQGLTLKELFSETLSSASLLFNLQPRTLKVGPTSVLRWEDKILFCWTWQSSYSVPWALSLILVQPGEPVE